MTCGRPSRARARASAHSATSTNSHDDGSGISEAWKLAPNAGSKLARGFDRFYGIVPADTALPGRSVQGLKQARSQNPAAAAMANQSDKLPNRLIWSLMAGTR